jgi:putative peptidoglycan lipid II flippase
MKRLLKQMGPGVLVASVFQINLVINMIIGSTLAPGSISHLYYADRLYQLPFGVIGIAVGTALLPMFAAALARADRSETQNLYNRSIEYMLILTLPCTFGLLIAADPIVRAIYLHGAFTTADVAGTTYVLMAYALGLPAYVLTRVYNAVFYAHQDTWTPVKMSLITTAINIPLSYILAQYMGAMGMAASTAFLGWVLLVLLARGNAAKGWTLSLDDRLNRAMPRIFFSTGLLVVALALCRYVLDDAFHGPLGPRIFALLALAAISFIVYFSAIFVTRALPLGDFKTYLTRKGRAQSHDTLTD